MKFRYSKLAAIGPFTLIAIVTAFIYFYMYPLSHGPSTPSHSFGNFSTRNGLIIIFIASAVRYLPETWNRYIELHDNYIECHSFRYPFRTKALSLHLKYDNVYMITNKGAGPGGLSIYENSLDHPIRITAGFIKHKKLNEEICRRVLQANPKAVVPQSIRERLM